MSFTEIVRMALSSLGANKLRSSLTMIGITIGVFSVIGVMTAVSALRGSVETGLSFLGSDIFQITRWPSGFQLGNPNGARIGARQNITLAQANRYSELMGDFTDTIALTVSSGGAKASYGGRETTPNLQLNGTNVHYLTANKFTIEVGRNFTPEDIELARPVVIVGQDIVKKLFPNESPIDKRIKLRARTYTIIGVLASKGLAFGQTQDGVSLIPITRFMSDFGSNRSVTIGTQAPSPDRFNETVDRAITAMRIARSLRPEADNDFEFSSNQSSIDAFAKVADTLQIGSLGISGIALLAAGVGIMNIMLVSVTERTKEIGIRKSIGARKASILTQFLVEAVAISVAGGLMGIFLGVVGGNALALMLKATVVFPWLWAGAGIAVCCAIGVGFGFYPAWKAASLDPIEALRYE